MAGDVDELALARHERAEVAARPFLEGGLVGPVDEDHVQAEAGHLDPADRLALRRLAPVARRLARDRQPFGGQAVPRGPERAELREALVVARREAVLLPARVERRERVLPLPDDDDPEQGQHAADDHERAEDPDRAPHRTPNVRRTTAGARRLVRRARTILRTSSRSGPRCGRSPGPGYGA